MNESATDLSEEERTLMKILLKTPVRSATLCRYQIQPDRKWLVEEYRGRVCLHDLKDLAAKVADDPFGEELCYRLIDLGEAVFDLSVDEVVRFALVLRAGPHRVSGWHAFVVGDEAGFSMARMISHWARLSERSRFFPTRVEAEEWLARNDEAGRRRGLGMQVA